MDSIATFEENSYQNSELMDELEDEHENITI